MGTARPRRTARTGTQVHTVGVGTEPTVADRMVAISYTAGRAPAQRQLTTFSQAYPSLRSRATRVVSSPYDCPARGHRLKAASGVAARWLRQP